MVNIPLPPIMTVPTRAIAGFDLWSPVEAMIRCETVGPAVVVVVVVVVVVMVDVVVAAVLVVVVVDVVAVAVAAMPPSHQIQTLVWSNTFSSTDTACYSLYNGSPTSVD